MDWKRLSSMVMQDLEVWGHSVREVGGGSYDGGMVRSGREFRWTPEEISLKKLRGFWWENRRWFVEKKRYGVLVVWARYDERVGIVEGGLGILK